MYVDSEAPQDIIEVGNPSFWTSFVQSSRTTVSMLALIFESVYFLPSTLSSALKWRHDRKAHHITSFDLTTEKTNRIGSLFLHGNVKAEDRSAIIFLHGDYGHPFFNYPLIQTAQQASSKPVFSMHLPYDHSTPESEHRALFEEGIRKVQELFNEKGSVLKSLTLVGHSRGAIEATHYAFYRQFEIEKQNVTVEKVISIAGRLKVVDADWGIPCHPVIQQTVHEANRGVAAHPEIPLYQICGSRDWNAPVEAMAVRPQEGQCFVQKGAGHVGIVFSHETKRLLRNIFFS